MAMGLLMSLLLFGCGARSGGGYRSDAAAVVAETAADSFGTESGAQMDYDSAAANFYAGSGTENAYDTYAKTDDFSPEADAVEGAAKNTAERNAADEGTSDAADKMRPEDAANADGENDSAEKTEAAKSGRKLIRTVSITAETTRFDEVTARILAETERLGGYVEHSTAQYGDENRSFYITVRVPAEKADVFLQEALGGASISWKSERTEDVTLQYTDLAAKMKALRTEQDRLLELLAQADSVESIIALESRMSEIRYEIERIESSLRSYDNRVDYTTIDMTISEVSVITAEKSDGFFARVGTGLAKNTGAMLAFLETALIGILINLPLLIVLAVIGIFVYSIVRLIQKKRRTRVKRAHGLFRKDAAQFDARDSGRAEAAQREDARQSKEETVDSDHADDEAGKA